RIHHDQVLKPILFKHWKIDQLSGLTDEAKQARDEIVAHMARIDRIATKLGHPVGPSVTSGEPQD
ncbi:MAG: acyl-ACP desaturase, partial [Actinomycetota bacterium]